MNALDYLKEAQRMCKSYPDCKGCPLLNSACGFIRSIEGFSDADMRCAIKVVEQWSKEHPIITNAQKFEEVFGSVPSHKISSSWTTTNPNNESRMMTENYIGIKVGWWDEPYKEP